MVLSVHYGRSSAGDEANAVQSQTILLDPSALSTALADFWHQRLLCDVVLRTTSTSGGTPGRARARGPTSAASPHSGLRNGSGNEPDPGGSCPQGLSGGSLNPTRGRHGGVDATVEADTDVGGGDDGEAGTDVGGETDTVEGASVIAVAGDTPGAAGGGGGGGLARASDEAVDAAPSDADMAAGMAAAEDEEEDVGEVEDLPAHRLLLAATCDYFRALMTGAGAAMNDMRAAAAAGAAAAAAAACGGGNGDGGFAAYGSVAAGAAAAAVVVLPGLDGWALRLAVGALYERRVEVTADNLEGLISAASYLGAAALLDACSAFMRANLGLRTCLPLLLLAWRYSLGPLRDELISYVCRRFSVLVRTRLSTDGWAAPGGGGGGDGGGGGCPNPLRSSPASSPSSELRLSSLPLDLLVELLRNEELLAECESDVLQCALEWLAEQEEHGGGATALRAAASSSASASGDGTSPAARELARLVHWAALPDPPHLHLTPTRGSAVGPPIRALAALLAAHKAEWGKEAEKDGVRMIHGSVPVASSGDRVPPAVLRLRRLLADLQGAASAPPAPDLAPYGPAAEAAEPPLSYSAAIASRGNGVGVGLGEALRRVGPVLLPPGGGSRGAAAGGSSGGGGGRRRRHVASCLLAAGGHDGSWRAVKAVEMYDPRTDQWVAGPSLMQGLSFTAAAMVPGSIHGLGFLSGSGDGSCRGPQGGSCGAAYLVGGTPLCSAVWRLPWGSEGPGGWEPCPPLLVPRAHAGVVAVAGTLTVLGGRSQVQQVQHVLNSVEFLSAGRVGGGGSEGASGCPSSSAAACGPSGGGWLRGPNMAVPRSAHACVVMGGRIFALGGAGSGGAGGGGAVGGHRGSSAGAGSVGSTHRSGEFLDLGSGRWQLLGCVMATERKYTAAASHGGRIYVAGGVNDCRTRLSSLEALDPREGRWSALQPMSAPRSSHAMAALGGCLYVAGGQCNSADLLAPIWSSTAAAARHTAAVSLSAAAPPFGPIFGSPGRLGAYGTSPPTASYGRVSMGGTGLYGSAPSPSPAAGLGLGLGTGPGPIGGGFTAATGGGAAGGGISLGFGGTCGGCGGEDVTVLSGMECYDVVAGRWRLCAPLSHGGRAGLALCAA